MSRNKVVHSKCTCVHYTGFHNSSLLKICTKQKEQDNNVCNFKGVSNYKRKVFSDICCHSNEAAFLGF